MISVPAAFFTTFQENTVNNETETISEGDEAAPCLVSDILYNHGQQVGDNLFTPRQKQSSFFISSG